MRYARVVPKHYTNSASGDYVRVRRFGTRITVGKTSGIEAMPMYAHNKSTLRNLMEKMRVKKYKINVRNFGARKRLLLQFWKTGK